jgi:hypothetical protein
MGVEQGGLGIAETNACKNGHHAARYGEGYKAFVPPKKDIANCARGSRGVAPAK